MRASTSAAKKARRSKPWPASSPPPSAAFSATARASRPLRAIACAFRSSAQLIDDAKGQTIAAASTLEESFKKSGAKKDSAAVVGKLIAERAKAKGVKRVIFDRGGYLFHGRVKALADAAREGGLEF